VAGGQKDEEYPQRPSLTADLCGLWKAARRRLPPEWRTSILDGDGWDLLYRLADRLARHLSFERLTRRELRDALTGAVRRYKAPGGRGGLDNRQFAAEVLDSLAREPLRRTVYLGVQHLTLPHQTTMGDARFLLLSRDQELAQSFARFGDLAPQMACEVKATGGTEALLLDRARRAAEDALALVRQQVLFGGHSKIYLDQVIFGLNGTYTWRAGEEELYTRAGWWRQTRPIPVDFTAGDPSAWLAGLAGLTADYGAMAPGLRQRVDTCVGCLDVAARTDRWRIMLPAIFSAMEAILVPETSSALKAGVVTVRSVAVHIALNKEFFSPDDIVLGYGLRSDLVHGAPTSGVPDKEAADFAESRRYWAYTVFRDYLKLAAAIKAAEVADIISYLDREHCDKVCAWLEASGGSEIVTEYRKSVAPNASAG
jgi:hypothetical protein